MFILLLSVPLIGSVSSICIDEFVWKYNTAYVMAS